MTDDNGVKKSVQHCILAISMFFVLPAASGDAEVSLTVSACPVVSEAEIARILNIELRTIAAGKAAVSASPTAVTATCNNDNAILRADIVHNDNTFSKTVPLTEAAPDRNERLIAIAAAELVFSAWVAVSPKTETNTTPAAGILDGSASPDDSTVEAPSEASLSTVPLSFDPGTRGAERSRARRDNKGPAASIREGATPPSALGTSEAAPNFQEAVLRDDASAVRQVSDKKMSPEESTASSQPELPSSNNYRTDNGLIFQIELGPLWRMYVSSATHLFGGELDLRISPIRPLYLRVGVTVEGGRADKPLGRVNLFAVSGAGTVGIREQVFKLLTAGAALGGRFGVAVLSGKSANSDIFDKRIKGGFGGPMLALFVSTPSNPYVAVTAEVGYAVYGNVGHVEVGANVTTTKVWLSTILAAGVGF